MNFSEFTVIDLTHPIKKRMTLWPGDPQTVIERVAKINPDAYLLNRLSIGEHSGTHVGAPSHFNPMGIDISQVPADRLFRPAVKVDASKFCHEDADYLLPLDAILAWEKENGTIPTDSFFILQTGWSQFWNTEKYLGQRNEGLHFPGLSVKAGAFLVHERKVCGIGIDTHGIDGGQSEDFAVNHLLAKKELLHLENLVNLDRLPGVGGWLFIGALPIVGGSGSPCRVLAIF